jgi:SAM-dependent MidA family methyltransferase
MKARGTQRNNPGTPRAAQEPVTTPPEAHDAKLGSTTALRGIIRAGIETNGPMRFSDFMHLALYHARHGYYRSGRAAIGRHGDYFTNVSVGALFGTLLARQCAEMWERLGHPREFTIVEQGAHGGELALDILAAAEQLLPAFHRAIRYVIVEPAPRLRRRQRERLGPLFAKVLWRRSLDELAPFCGVHFSNELLDAFPVDAFVWTGTTWMERRVDVFEDRFVFVEVPVANAIQRRDMDEYPAPPGIRYALEINQAADAWIDSVARRLRRGYMLAIDYGAPRRDLIFPARTTGTLRGYAQHRLVTDLLAHPGANDLTAHVDFTALATRAERNALRLHGFADQHHFMVGLGRLHFHDAPLESSAAQRERRSFTTLMHPELMGTSFRAICFEKGLDKARAAPLAGFQFAPDPRSALDLVPLS